MFLVSHVEGRSREPCLVQSTQAAVFRVHSAKSLPGVCWHDQPDLLLMFYVTIVEFNVHGVEERQAATRLPYKSSDDFFVTKLSTHTWRYLVVNCSVVAIVSLHLCCRDCTVRKCSFSLQFCTPVSLCNLT